MAKFHFVTNWEILATLEEVYPIIKDSSKLCDWWPSVYLELKTLQEGDPDGIGKIVSLHTKGYLPYTLRWSFEVMEIIKNKKIALRAFGDLSGNGVWTFNQKEDTCIVNYDWDISFEKPYLSKLAWLLRPIFSFNHRWAMNKGLESIQLEIRRKRGEKNVPDPPQAIWV
jgi:hypothetical protein